MLWRSDHVPWLADSLQRLKVAAHVSVKPCFAVRLLVQFRLQAVGGLLQLVLLLSCNDIAHVALGRVLVG